MKIKNSDFFTVSQVLTMLLLFVTLDGNAQKLSGSQEVNLLLTTNPKVDGKSLEINNIFQAYNKSTSLYYTMANTKDKFYLVIQATDLYAIDKVMAGGVTLTLFNKKVKADAVKITYPLIPIGDRLKIIGKIKDPKFNIDSALSDINKQLEADSKEIKVHGIKNVTDSLISVYNDSGIKALGLLDNKKAYTYELVIPLQLLKEKMEDGWISYNLMLNGINVNNFVKREETTPGKFKITVSQIPSNSGGGTAAFQNLTHATDFSGAYQLAN